MAHLTLIVDDDPTQRRLLQAQAEKCGFQTLLAASGQEALDMLEGPKGAGVSLILLDMVMPGMDGLAVLQRIRPTHPTLPVIVLTAQGGVDIAVAAMRAGADDFLVKPASPERIQVSIQNALKLKALTGEIQRLKKVSDNRLTFGDLIAESPSMRTVLRMAERAAQSNIPILIEGESGVGKEVLARAIQGGSERSGKPFVAVNCGAIPDTLIESILFGHEKGAFTGAVDKHIGKFQEANGGTLFLDEIGELRLDMQVKLLRAIQEGEVDPVGAKRPVKVDIRLVSATNRNLQQQVAEGKFREDLFYRLNVFPIALPPLRERREDIPALVAYFIRRFAVEENKKLVGIEPAALDMLTNFAWPGNIRQLENTVFRAVVMCDGDCLRAGDFPQVASQLGIAVRATHHDDEEVEGGTRRYVSIAAPPHAPAVEPGAGKGDGLNVVGVDGHLRKLEEIEFELIRFAIEKYEGHMSEVARRLGIGRSTLYRKLREMGIDEPKAGAA
ncbi:MAG: sigma-54-dependent Fis family transcriptional regulator [Alphaproteobacteria bacterium]|nr:sigma-54-dependent Fis family transcriptional regulator [Alphaproteobacteria bacterium]